jgi:hypothetical protein
MFFLLLFYHRFAKALNRRQAILPATPVADPEPPLAHWFFKLTYHPQDPPSSAIFRAWQQTVADPPFIKVKLALHCLRDDGQGDQTLESVAIVGRVLQPPWRVAIAFGSFV